MPEKTNGELAFVLMDAETLRTSLREIAHQSLDIADRGERERAIMDTLLKHIPAEKQAKARELLENAGERETWLTGQLQLAAKIVAGAIELAKTFQEQRDREISLRLPAQRELDRLVGKLENGDTDHPLLEQFLSMALDGYMDLE